MPSNGSLALDNLLNREEMPPWMLGVRWLRLYRILSLVLSSGLIVAGFWVLAMAWSAYDPSSVPVWVEGGIRGYAPPAPCPGRFGGDDTRSPLRSRLVPHEVRDPACSQPPRQEEVSLPVVACECGFAHTETRIVGWFLWVRAEAGYPGAGSVASVPLRLVRLLPRVHRLWPGHVRPPVEGAGGRTGIDSGAPTRLLGRRGSAHVLDRHRHDVLRDSAGSGVVPDEAQDQTRAERLQQDAPTPRGLAEAAQAGTRRTERGVFCSGRSMTMRSDTESTPSSRHRSWEWKLPDDVSVAARFESIWGFLSFALTAFGWGTILLGASVLTSMHLIRLWFDLGFHPIYGILFMICGFGVSNLGTLLNDLRMEGHAPACSRLDDSGMRRRNAVRRFDHDPPSAFKEFAREEYAPPSAPNASRYPRRGRTVQWGPLFGSYFLTITFAFPLCLIGTGVSLIVWEMLLDPLEVKFMVATAGAFMVIGATMLMNNGFSAVFLRGHPNAPAGLVDGVRCIWAGRKRMHRCDMSQATIHLDDRLA